MMVQLSRYIAILPSGRTGYLLLYSSKRGATILVPESLPEQIRQGTLDPQDQQTLQRLGFLVPDLQAERQEMRGILDYGGRVRPSGSIVLVMNLDCNMACTYCYEGRAKGSDRYLTDATAEKVVSFLRQQLLARGKGLDVVFHGGEPLLSLPLVKGLAQELKGSCEEKGLPFSFSLITNGTLLTRPTVEELLPLGLNGVRTTLDGPRQCHDRSRPFISGKGTYDIIVRNMLEVADLVKLQLGGNYTKENYQEFPRLLDDLLAQGLTPKKIGRVQFSPVSATTKELAVTDFQSGCLASDDPWMLEASIFLREETLRRGFSAPQVMPAACLVEFPDDLVINYEGKIFKCPAFVGIPELAVGDVVDGIAEYRESHNVGAWKNDECLDCSYLPLCFGGCRFLQYLRTGSLKGIECRKGNLDATLQPFLQQDIRYPQKDS